MAPALVQSLFEKRQYNNGYGYNNCDIYGCSRWNSWGRWVALAVIIVVFILLAVLFSCYSNRRRRRRGMAPMYGTGWFAGKPPVGQYGNSNGYYNSAPYNGGAAPPYEAAVPNQATGTTFNSNDGYYGHHNYGYGQAQPGIELQPPTSAYQPQRGGDPVYEAPMGPPPGKGDRIVR